VDYDAWLARQPDDEEETEVESEEERKRAAYEDHCERVFEERRDEELIGWQARANLGEALPREMARVRDVVMPQYAEIGAPGVFALAMMRADLDLAAKAMIEGDIVEMVRVYQTLKETK